MEQPAKKEILDTENTKRITVPALEEILEKEISVLDHGFIRVIDYMGSDSSIVQAARVSYGKGTKQKSQDKGLINYLLRHKHTTPFEMCEIKFHIKLPMFVARQWIRHRTANVNEYSARYSILDNEFYIPEKENLATQSQTNKQGREAVIEGEASSKILNMFKQTSQEAFERYEYMINDEKHSEHEGLTRELARMNLPVNIYTQWYWKIDLHNLLHFVKLRADHHAQYEIRVYAQALLDILKKWVPLTYEAFMNYEVGNYNLSAEALKVVKKLIQGEKVEESDCSLSKREWQELMDKLELNV